LESETGESANQYVAQSEAYRRGIAFANIENAAIIFLNADVVIANGGISFLQTKLEEGKQAVFALGYRVNREDMYGELEQYKDVLHCRLNITSRELVKISLTHLHAISKAHIYDGGEEEGFHPAGLFWQPHQNLLIAHCFHLHPVIILPEKKNVSFSTRIDQDLIDSACIEPNKIYIVRDSDEFCAIELSPTDRRITTNSRTTANPNDIARWAHFNATTHHREFFRAQILIHAAELPNSASFWQTKEGCQAIINRVITELNSDDLFKTTEPQSEELVKLEVYNLVTPVWGNDYVKTFLEVMLPSLLSNENIPYLTSRSQCTYYIYTREADLSSLKESETINKLRAYCEIIFRIISPEGENKYEASSACYREVVQEAAISKARVVFLIPDMILANGSLMSIDRILNTGKKQILITGIRIIKEEVISKISEEYSKDGVITICSRDLIALALRHLHPITLTHMFDGDSNEFHPAGWYWKLGSEGILAKCFHLHPVALVPNEKSRKFSGTIDYDLTETSASYDKDIYVVTDSDEIQWCELSLRESRVPTPTRGSLLDIAKWIQYNTSAYHRGLVHNTIKIHTGSTDGPIWEGAHRTADIAVNRVLQIYFDLINSDGILASQRSKSLSFMALRLDGHKLMEDINQYLTDVIRTARTVWSCNDKSSSTPKRKTIAGLIICAYISMLPIIWVSKIVYKLSKVKLR
jgi:hypothetical protein